MKLVHAYDFLKLVEGSIDETPVSNYGYQEVAGRVMQDLLNYAEENPGTAKANIIREWAIYRPYVSYPLVRGAANPKRGTAWVTVAGIPKDPDLDIEAIIRSPESQEKAAEYELTVESVEDSGVMSLPMSRGKVGPAYKVHFTY